MLDAHVVPEPVGSAPGAAVRNEKKSSFEGILPEYFEEKLKDVLREVFTPVAHKQMEQAELSMLRQKRALTTAEVSKLYGIGKSTLDQWRMNGEGPTYTQSAKKGTVLYTHESMEKWLSENSVNSFLP